MSYCPECGSEVANTDTFCAYCGISLQVMSQSPATETPQPDNQPKIGEPEKIQTSASLDREPIIAGDNNSAQVEEPLPSPPPTPFILDSPPVSEAVAKTEDYNLPEDVQPLPAQSGVEAVADTPPEADLPNEPEIAEVVPTIGSTSDPVDSEALNTAATPPVDEFSATIPYTPADYLKQEFGAVPPAIPAENVPAAADEEERLLSVLDEIDLNLQAENNAISLSGALNDPESVSTPNEPVLDAGITAPKVTDAVADAGEPYKSESQDEVVPQKAVELQSEALPVTPVTQEAEAPQTATDDASDAGSSAVVAESTPAAENYGQSSESSSESRSYTNPNIGYGETDGRNKTKLKPLEEGTILNARYEVVRKIGGGGMGAVYLANDKNLGGVLRAVKEMVQSYIEDEAQEKAVSDFKRESLLLTSLEHPGIPTIYDYFFDEKEGRFYLVMKYISGGDLAARLRAAPEGRIDEVTVTDWAIQIADVLDYLHNRQPPIVYRDLKPSNIMIDGNTGKVMIIDFGIARWVNKEEKGVTAVGTMGYAPPELFSGNVEPRSDIYSLGSTMFHLLTGADPQSNPLLIFDFNKNPRPRQINPNLSDQMEVILMRAVEYNSEQRFTSAAEMRDELRNHLENLKKGAITFGVMSNAVIGQPLNNVPVFCGFCGQKIVATDMFCPFCGAQQPLVGQSQKLKSTPAYVAPRSTAKLLIVGTNDLEQTEYPLEKDSNLLGRRDPMSNIFPEVDMSKFDPQTKISRKHARIWREGDLYMLEDLGSSNGTILISSNNDAVRLLPRQPHVLSHGDKLKLGDTTLRFTVG